MAISRIIASALNQSVVSLIKTGSQVNVDHQVYIFNKVNLNMLPLLWHHMLTHSTAMLREFQIQIQLYICGT